MHPSIEVLPAKVEAMNKLRRLEYTAHGLLIEAFTPYIGKKIACNDRSLVKPVRARVNRIGEIIGDCLLDRVAIGFRFYVEVNTIGMVKLKLERNRVDGDLMPRDIKTVRHIARVGSDGILLSVERQFENPRLDDLADITESFKVLFMLKERVRSLESFLGDYL
jgi:hypothetical protein